MKKNILGYLIAIALTICAGLIGFAPVAHYNYVSQTDPVNLFQSINFGGYGRIPVGNLLAVIFLGVGLLILIIFCVLSLIKADSLGQIKGFILILNGAILMTAAFLFGFSGMMFYSLKSYAGITMTGDLYTEWGAVLGSIVTFFASFAAFYVGGKCFIKKPIEEGK